MAVPAQLFRMLLNLLLNAAQAIGEKEGTITVTLEAPVNEEGEKAESNGTHLLIRISDTGIGMDIQTAARIFDPYFTGGKKNGTGLGLTVVSDAVRELGGRIRVIPVQEGGTTFELLIPDAIFGSLPEKN
jgi:signal transduction histidine kinase